METNKQDNEWIKVVYASELPSCEICEEKWCKKCNEHFFECECPGPHGEDEWEYQERADGLWARLRKVTQ